MHYNHDYTDYVRTSKKRICSFSLIYETIIIIIHPLPFYNCFIPGDMFIDGEYVRKNIFLLSDILFALMFLRLIILVWNLFNYSIYSDVFAKRLCDRYGFTAGARFCFKCYIVKWPITTVLLTMFSAIFILSYLIRIAESPPDFYVVKLPIWFQSFLNCVYFTVITMATVGFGDFYPTTDAGKIISICNSIFGGFIVTLTIVTLSGIFNFTIWQK